MVKRKSTGVRRRVEGEPARHAARVIVERGYTIKQEGRLGDDTGYIIRTREGPVINLYDTGSILVTGNNRHRFDDVESLRFPDISSGVLVVANEESAALADLSTLLAGWGVEQEDTFFGSETWMMDVAEARKRGYHVLVLVVAGETALPAGSVRVAPGVYFGFGLLVARLGREYVTVICQDAVEMPSPGERLGAEVLRYGKRICELEERLTRRLARVGVQAGVNIVQ